MSAPTDRAGFRRDVRIIGLVGAAHFFSHFFQLTLPPLFPLLKEVWGVPYVALGLAMSVFYRHRRPRPPHHPARPRLGACRGNGSWNR